LQIKDDTIDDYVARRGLPETLASSTSFACSTSSGFSAAEAGAHILELLFTPQHGRSSRRCTRWLAKADHKPNAR